MLDDEKLKEAVENTATSPYAVSLIKHLIDKSGCFRQGLAKDEKTEFYNRGYGDFGLYIRNLLLDYSPETYIEIIKEGVKENERARNEH